MHFKTSVSQSRSTTPTARNSRTSKSELYDIWTRSIAIHSTRMTSTFGSLNSNTQWSAISSISSSKRKKSRMLHKSSRVEIVFQILNRLRTLPMKKQACSRDSVSLRAASRRTPSEADLKAYSQEFESMNTLERQSTSSKTSPKTASINAWISW